MPTELEETQVKEFLKRAEIKTMKKDLRALREFDALEERDKIATIKTLEEQRIEQEKKLQKKEEAQCELEKIKRDKILSENANQERLAEKDLKEYATEQERQQIFLFETQRFAFEKKIEEINTKKDPDLKLEKNQALLKKSNLQEKINSVIAEEKKIEEEQNFVVQKSQISTLASEKKSLEERRWEIEKNLQEIEKKRWEIEVEMKDIDEKIIQIDKSSELLINEKNDLHQKVLGVDKSLREIYSGIIERVEQQRSQKIEEQQKAKGVVAEARLKEKEQIQREQWGAKSSIPIPKKQTEKFSDNIAAPGFAPVAPIKKKVINISAEEAQRSQFIENIEKWAQEKNKQNQDNPSKDKEEIIPPKKISN